ncbi:MAG TPA: hypothetical protein VHX38_25880 [Pseudonocardiaceae bacterium]|nr:hypothetical protein [Pseudonocardiaceae bacterium]
MTSTLPDATSEQKTEDELWTNYMVALAREQENHRLYEESWHAYVSTGCRSSADQAAWYQITELWDASRNAVKAADSAWKRVAYPMHNIPLHEDELSS